MPSKHLLHELMSVYIQKNFIYSKKTIVLEDITDYKK